MTQLLQFYLYILKVEGFTDDAWLFIFSFMNKRYLSFSIILILHLPSND